jgi:hypothetical protein
MHPHEPQLLIALKDLANEDDEKWFQQIGGKDGLVDLTNYDVVIKPDGQGSGAKNLKPNDLAGKKKGCPIFTNNGDLSWLVDLNDLTGSPSRADLTGSHPPSVVTGRVFLTEGDLDCIGHTSENGNVRKYKFDSRPERAIADATRCQLKGHKTALFELNPIRPGPPRFAFSLKVPSTVLVANSAQTGAGGSVEHHFSAFYGLLDPPPSPEPTLSDTGECGKNEGLVFAEKLGLPINPPRRPCPQAMLYKS